MGLMVNTYVVPKQRTGAWLFNLMVMEQVGDVIRVDVKLNTAQFTVMPKFRNTENVRWYGVICCLLKKYFVYVLLTCATLVTLNSSHFI